MPTAPSFVEHVMDQLTGVFGVTSRKMFGEYALYVGEKVVALICNDQVFVKPTEAGRAYIGTPDEAPPYPGAKPSFLIGEALDRPGWLAELITLTTRELPSPKPKKARADAAAPKKRK